LSQNDGHRLVICEHCRGYDTLHSITCIEVARQTPYAMINDHGEVFYPDGLEDARYFATAEHARPLNPGQFPWKDEM
jgi:hypothetical protein